MRNPTVTIKDTTTDNLIKYQTKLFKDVVNLVTDSIKEVEILATRGAPAFINISSAFENKGLTGIVGVMQGGEVDVYENGTVVGSVKKDGNDMAAYIEFGTGLSAREILAPYPEWVRRIAIQFYVNGKGLLQGKPYLFNNFLVINERFKKELDELVKKTTNDN